MKIFNITFSIILLTLAACSSSDKPVATHLDPLPETKPVFSEFKDVKQKKKAFFDYMFAHIVHANYEIKLERDFIKEIDFSGKNITKKQNEQLTQLCNKYSKNCENVFREDLKQELLNEVNFIPAGLALAQSANESSWGTSRFSLKGNNYFGQWCFTKGCGIVPNSRNEGAKHEVRSFDSTLDSVKAYMFNINTHYAYDELRAIREGKEFYFDSNELAKGLIRYSERGEEYIKEVQAMIRINNLQEYDLKLEELLK